jgi:hypothetical protein
MVLFVCGVAGNHLLSVGKFLDSLASCPGRYLNFSGLIGVTVGALLIGMAFALKAVKTIPPWTFFAAAVIVGGFFGFHIVQTFCS